MVNFTPINLINKRIEIAKQDSDTAMFWHLMYSGEQLVKLVVSGLLACVDDDNSRHRYSQEYRLVRADGIGEWATSLDEIISGPTSQYLCSESRALQKELIEGKKNGAWQHDAVNLLGQCLQIVDSKFEPISIKVSGRTWFNLFARLRNKTRGHGAMSATVCSKLSPYINSSINLIVDNFSLFSFQWAYVKRNLNGKYRISPISMAGSAFNHLKSERKENYEDGIYLHAGSHRRLKLICSDPELEDFFFPNGSFGKNTFEAISYITDKKTYQDVAPFILPPGTLPKSQTEGLGKLELKGHSFTNIPSNPIAYIKRAELENELLEKLLDERHPVITLIGRGGIGKTSLAISVLEKLNERKSFNAIIWFSARDIDLLVEGAKPVKPGVLTIPDISNEFISLLEFNVEKGITEREVMQNELIKSSFGPILFVFDNFETVVNPREVYSWLNTFIRLPNKILITSRFRDFKGDYPIEVHGMKESEFNLLVENVAKEIGLEEILHDKKYLSDLFIQSDGHPYVAKILLGERLKNKHQSNVKIVLAGKDDILIALFERTYNYLSPLAKRIFLTVSNWRSIIPEIALEAVLLKNQSEPIDVEESIDELSKSSLIETIRSEDDDSYFISVPLSAAIFGKKKLSVDPLKSAIEADTLLLQSFGAGSADDAKRGLKPRIMRLFSEVANKVSSGQNKLTGYLPILEFICSKYHNAWLLLSELYEEEGQIEDAIKSIQKYLESPPIDESIGHVWQRLAKLYRFQGNWQGELHAFVEICLVPDISFIELSNSANDINRLLNENKYLVDSLEKRIAIEKVATVFNSRINKKESINGDDYSRLGWLYMHLQNYPQAKKIAFEGLKISPNNVYCQNLYDRIS